MAVYPRLDKPLQNPFHSSINEPKKPENQGEIELDTYEPQYHDNSYVQQTSKQPGLPTPPSGMLWKRITPNTNDCFQKIALNNIEIARLQSYFENRATELNTLKERTVNFLSSIPGTREFRERAELLATIPIAANHQEEMETFVTDQANTQKQIEAMDRSLGHHQSHSHIKPFQINSTNQLINRLPPSVSSVITKTIGYVNQCFQNVYKYIYKEPEKAPGYAKTYLTNQAYQLINSISFEHHRLKTEIKKNQDKIQTLLDSSIQETRCFEQECSKLTAPKPLDHNFFYKRFQCIHRGGDLLKGEGEFVLAESTSPLTPEIERLIKPFLENLPKTDPKTTRTLSDTTDGYRSIQQISNDEEIIKMNLVDGRLEESPNGTIWIYKIPVRAQADAFMDYISLGSRQRYEIRNNCLVFKNKKYKEIANHNEWTLDRQRTAALERLQGLLIMQEFDKRIIENKLNTIEFSHFDNSIAFLHSLESNDLARASNGGYLNEPVFKANKKVFEEIKKPLQDYIFAQHAYKRTQEVIANKTYSWEEHNGLGKKIDSLLTGMTNIKNLSTYLKNLLENDALHQQDQRWTWVILQVATIEHTATKVKETLQALKQDPNSDKCMKEVLSAIRELYIATTKFDIISRADVFQTIIDNYPQKIWGIPLVFPGNSKEFDIIKEKIREFSMTLQSKLPLIKDEFKEIVKGSPFGEQTLSTLEYYRKNWEMYDEKESVKANFVRYLLSKPYELGLQTIFNKSS